MHRVAISLIRRPCNCDQCRRTTWPKAESAQMDLRGAPGSELDAIRRHVKSVQPYMVVAQHIDDRLSDEALRTLCNQQVNQGGYFLLNTRACPREQDSTWDTSLGFWTNLCGLILSFAEPGEGSSPSLRVCQTCCGGCSRICHRSIPANGIGATMGRDFLHCLANAIDWSICKC